MQIGYDCQFDNTRKERTDRLQFVINQICDAMNCGINSVSLFFSFYSKRTWSSALSNCALHKKRKYEDVQRMHVYVNVSIKRDNDEYPAQVPIQLFSQKSSLIRDLSSILVTEEPN